MSDDDLVVVRTFLNRMEADLAKSVLDSAGLESLVRADDTGGTRPGLWMSGVQLLVRSADAPEARRMLGQ